jgi:Cu-Zn family superoxide dismutase
MNVRSTVAVAAILGTVAVGGAWTVRRPAVPDGARLVLQSAQGMKWTATLKSETGSTVAGTATLGSGSGAGTSVATISITGGTPGASYPWHIHTGKCGAGGVFGGGAAYKPVKAGSDGTGTSTADLKAAVPSSGDYHVNVHASSTDMKTVACGELSMAGM